MKIKVEKDLVTLRISLFRKLFFLLYADRMLQWLNGRDNSGKEI